MASSFGRGFDSLQLHTEKAADSFSDYLPLFLCGAWVIALGFAGFGKSPE